MNELGAFFDWMIVLLPTLAIFAAWLQIKVATSTQTANRFLFVIACLAMAAFVVYYIFFLALPEQIGSRERTR